MNILNLTPDLVMRVTGDPALYTVVDFLEPMREEALKLTAKFVGCPSCQRPAYLRAAALLGGALARLCLEAPAEKLPLLRVRIVQIINVQDVDRVMLSYTRADGVKSELVF